MDSFTHLIKIYVVWTTTPKNQEIRTNLEKSKLGRKSHLKRRMEAILNCFFSLRVIGHEVEKVVVIKGHEVSAYRNIFVSRPLINKATLIFVRRSSENKSARKKINRTLCGLRLQKTR